MGGIAWGICGPHFAPCPALLARLKKDNKKTPRLGMVGNLGERQGA